MSWALGSRFAKLWVGAGISNFGDGVMAAAFPLLVASITRDPVIVAGATVVGRLPWLLFALVSGALVDRFDRRRVMVSTDAFRAVLVGLLGALLFIDDVGVPSIYAAAFLLGVAETLFDTSSEAILPALVGDDLLPAANGRLQATEWIGNAFLGPPVGATLFTLAVGLPFVLNGVTFIVASLLVWSIGGAYRSHSSRPKATLRSEIGLGVRWLWGHSVLRTLSLMAGLTNMATFGILAVFVLFVQDIVGLDDLGFGLIMSAVGFGGLIGAMISSRLVGWLGPGTTLLSSVALQAISAAILWSTSEAWAVAITAALFGLSITSWNVVAVSLRQSMTPDHLRGRVASVSRMLAWGSQPVGALLGGLVAARFGLRSPILVAAVASLVMLLVTAPIVNNRRIAAMRRDIATT